VLAEDVPAIGASPVRSGKNRATAASPRSTPVSWNMPPTSFATAPSRISPTASSRCNAASSGRCMKRTNGRFIKVATSSATPCSITARGRFHRRRARRAGNKRYLIEGQGNFGNIFTGDIAAAPRYIECRLTALARTELFNDENHRLRPSYDGRNQEPVVLPSKLPLLLMLGTEGVAVGMACKILPHNFPSCLRRRSPFSRSSRFKCLPDFPTGGLMDARGYADARAASRCAPRSRRRTTPTVVIKEIPPSTTTDSLIGSIEDAARKGKIKVKSIK